MEDETNTISERLVAEWRINQTLLPTSTL